MTKIPMTQTKRADNCGLEEQTYQFAKEVPLYNCFGHLVIRIWNLFDIWCLEFVILTFEKVKLKNRARKPASQLGFQS
ncbi:MAG: hypothetical protein ACE5WD_12035 [Candidatus Aminicenantia bacterium]